MFLGSVYVVSEQFQGHKQSRVLLSVLFSGSAIGGAGFPYLINYLKYEAFENYKS